MCRSVIRDSIPFTGSVVARLGNASPSMCRSYRRIIDLRTIRLCATLLLVVGAHVVSSFQVNPDGSPAYTETAVEKTIKTPKPMDTRPYHESIFISAEMVSGLPTLPDVTERVDPGPTNYWFNSKIHTFGNTGFFGGLHAAVAPLFTKLIDVVAYDGNPVRDEISQNLRSRIGKPNARVLDLCCGVGNSTRALQSAFKDAEVVLGIDTSPEMIAMATMQSSKNLLTHFAKVIDSCMEFGSRAVKERMERFPTYAIGNAEHTDLSTGSFDLVTIMYGFHEILGRYKILREVRRLLAQGATLAIVDISPDYEPSPSMLAGEPYVLEFKRNIHKQLGCIRGFANVRYKEMIPGDVGVWLLTRKAAKRGFRMRLPSMPLANSGEQPSP